ncbi:MAG: ferredoxin thioredoxin reductase catalytic beta chain [Oscillospiraceae bacterium]|nr:ferredoxin thioredoxin reductase catalytic beta chain [Oscillospiraceae bacterium]
MKGYKLNEDENYVSKIIAGIYKKNGHCPCRVNSDDSTLCPCDEFMEQQICRCNLFVKSKASGDII